MKNNVLALLFIILYLYSSIDFCKCDSYDDFKNVISSKDFDLICLRKNRNVGLEQKIDKIFGAIEQKIRSDRWTIIVFSEYFFNIISNPLGSIDVIKIVQKCADLTSRFPNVITHINFLHKFDTENEDIQQIKWLFGNLRAPDWQNPIDYTSRTVNFDGDLANGGKKRIANYSLVIWNGEPISIYTYPSSNFIRFY